MKLIALLLAWRVAAAASCRHGGPGLEHLVGPLAALFITIITIVITL